MASSEPSGEAAPAVTPLPRVRFLHAFCTDVGAMRRFYVEGIGLPLLHEMDQEAYGWLVVDSGDGVQLMFHRWDEGPLPMPPGWAWQPGDGAGDQPLPSQGMHVPEAVFATTVARLQAMDVPAMSAGPTWRQDSYWGWTVRDPAGYVVELYTSLAERPEGDPPTWPEGSGSSPA